jgi:hypothetical protein
MTGVGGAEVRAPTACQTIAIRDVVTVAPSLVDWSLELRSNQLENQDRFMQPAAKKNEPFRMAPGLTVFPCEETVA